MQIETIKKQKTNAKSDELAIDYNNIDLDNYLNINLEKYKIYLYQLQFQYNNKIKKIKNLIKNVNTKIALKCEIKNKTHEWIKERENCIYGETYTYCKKCKIDYHDRTYIHY